MVESELDGLDLLGKNPLLHHGDRWAVISEFRTA
jgi:hypothetical protein